MVDFHLPVLAHSHVDARSDLGLHQGQDVVCVENVSFAYEGRAALQNITLHVKGGSTLGIIGPNGGGKSTLMKLLLGVLTPAQGTIRVLGLEPNKACAQGELVGYVPQRHSIDWSFPISVRQVVELGLIGRKGLGGRFKAQDHQSVREVLEAVDMARRAEEPIGGLSGGQQQRVFIARALVSRPRILFLDEPMTGIDQHGQERFVGLLERVKQQFGLTLVMVSHDLRAVMASCDRVACLNRTLHYHDRPQSLSRDLLFSVFQCDMDALLEKGTSGAPGGSCCSTHAPPDPPRRAGEMTFSPLPPE